jgi:hypothetical protein
MRFLSKSRAYIAAFLAIMVFTVTGCATFTKTTYQTLATTATMVNAARSAYDTFYKEGKVPAATEAKVVVAYAKYQNAMRVAINSVRLYDNLKAQGLTVSPEQANANIALVTSAISELFKLFTEAGVPALGPIAVEKR